MRRPVRRLILVYRADRGWRNAVLDSARKLFGFDPCTLCTITHGLAGERPAWRAYRESLDLPVEELHRDEIPASLREVIGDRLPCVVAVTDDGPSVVLDPDDLAACRGRVDAFRSQLEARVVEEGRRLDAET